MKIKFTDEQIKYLNDCANAAYSARWNICKDDFILLDNFIDVLKKSNDLNKDFCEFLHELDIDNPNYPF